MATQIKSAVSFGFILVLSISSWVTLAQETVRPTRETATAAQDSALRGVFLGKDDDPVQSHRVVGRLAILLKTEEGSFRHVRSDYSFRSGDRFRFEVTANQDGWLYVMHSAAGSDWQQLWPSGTNKNKVESQQSYQIPPAPGIFIFDKDTGNEFFYVVIRSNATPPTKQAADASTARTRQPTNAQVQPSKTPSGETVNFLVRDPFGESTRGVIFDPGKDDGDPYLYFSSALEDTTKVARIKFQLHHSD